MLWREDWPPALVNHDAAQGFLPNLRDQTKTMFRQFSPRKTGEHEDNQSCSRVPIIIRIAASSNRFVVSEAAVACFDSAL